MAETERIADCDYEIADANDFRVRFGAEISECFAGALSHFTHRGWVTVTDDALTVDLDDGRTISVPLAWFPRLFQATPTERGNWSLVGKGEGIHWPDLDEDISVKGLVAGQPSGESQRSLKRWLEARAQEKDQS